MATAKKKRPRYDLLVSAENNHQRLSENMIQALIQRLIFKGTAIVTEEVMTSGWSEIYMEAGPAAHEIFVRGGFTGPKPVFHELVIRYGEEADVVEYGGLERRLSFYIEVRGCLFKEPRGEFRKLLRNALHVVAKVLDRPYEGLPPHKQAPEIEETPGVEFAAPEGDRGADAGVGTEVSEW